MWNFDTNLRSKNDQNIKILYSKGYISSKLCNTSKVSLRIFILEVSLE